MAQVWVKVNRLSRAVGLALGVVLVSCGHVRSQQYELTAIADLEPAQATVFLQGTVGAQVPFVGSGAYALEDGTGQVWIITGRRLPARGSEVTLQGEIQFRSIPMDNEEFGELYVMELNLVDPSLVRSPQVATKPEVTAPVDVVQDSAPSAVDRLKEDLQQQFWPHKAFQK